MRPRLRLLLPLLLGLAAGCAVTSAQRRQEALTTGIREMNDGLRWGRYNDVARYMSPADAKLLRERIADLGEDFRLADDELQSVEMMDEGTAAKVTVEFTWYTESGSLVKKSTVEEQWKFEGDRWTVTDQKRVRGDRFPLVPEKLKKTDGGADTSANAS